MTPEQFDRWRDFALRMARTCFKRSRRPDEAWIIAEVESWFWWRDFQEDWHLYNSWDQDEYPLCDHVAEFWGDYGPSCLPVNDDDVDEECSRRFLAREQYADQWLGPVMCCLRAGIDLACQPSAGVLGFTAGDLRRMYPEGVPEWVFPPGERLHYWLSDEVNGTFEELSDDAGVVL